MTAVKTKVDLGRLLAGVRLPAGAECELTRLERKRRSTGWADGSPDLQGASSSTGYALRVLRNGAQGLLKVPDLTEENIAGFVLRALEIAAMTPEDAHRVLAKTSTSSGAVVENDGHIFSRSLPALRGDLETIEKSTLKLSSKLKKVVRLHVEEEWEELSIANSHGLKIDTSATNTSFVAEVLAEENGQTEIAWDALSARFGADIDKEEVVREAAELALRSLGGKPISSGVYTVLIDPRVGTQILTLLAQALSADAVQTNRSFLKGRLGELVAAPVLSIVDDPTLPRGIASEPFDHEGVAAVKLPVVENGALRNFFFDLRTAHKEGRASNGRGFRGGLGTPPSPQPTNLCILPGPQDLSGLLSTEKTVFFLHDIMGLHMAEPVTGEFSFGASGFLYENGRFSKPVRGMTLAGTVGDLLKNTVAVGNKIHWRSSFGAPHWLVRGMTLSGN